MPLTDFRMFKIKIYCTTFVICGVYCNSFWKVFNSFPVECSAYSFVIQQKYNTVEKFNDKIHKSMLTQKENWLDVNLKQSKAVKTN